MIRCHTCGTEKQTSNNIGIYITWMFEAGEKSSRIVVWFHDESCFDKWKTNAKANYDRIEYSEKTGVIKEAGEKFGNNNDEI